MGRLIQVLGFLMNKSRIAIKTGRIILLLSPEGHLMFYAPPLEGKAWGADPPKSPVTESTIQRRSTNRRVYRSRGQVVRRNRLLRLCRTIFHVEAAYSSV
jgi:hypothetical protein